MILIFFKKMNLERLTYISELTTEGHSRSSLFYIASLICKINFLLVFYYVSVNYDNYIDEFFIPHFYLTSPQISRTLLAF